MDWQLVTEAEVKTVLTEYEWDAVTTAARAANAADTVTKCINRVVLKVRGYVESNPQNTLGPDGYVPALLLDSTLVLIRQALATSLPGSGIIEDENRQRRVTDALNELKLVADGKLKISGPGSGQTTPADAPAIDGGSYGGETPVDFSGIR